MPHRTVTDRPLSVQICPGCTVDPKKEKSILASGQTMALRGLKLNHCPLDPDRKKYSLLKDKYFCEDSSMRYLLSKIFEYAQ